MEEKFNESTINRPKGDRLLDASLVTIDLPAYIKQLKEEEAWQKNDRNAITVFKTEGLNIVIVALHQDAVMKPPVASEGNTSVQVIEGNVLLNVEEQSTKINPQQIVAFREHQPFSITALKETVFVLTMTDKED
ncbi:MAG: hypothetical protein ACTHJ5_15635 [Ilyomonas sp.]